MHTCEKQAYISNRFCSRVTETKSVTIAPGLPYFIFNFIFSIFLQNGQNLFFVKWLSFLYKKTESLATNEELNQPLNPSPPKKKNVGAPRTKNRLGTNPCTRKDTPAARTTSSVEGHPNQQLCSRQSGFQPSPPITSIHGTTFHQQQQQRRRQRRQRGGGSGIVEPPAGQWRFPTRPRPLSSFPAGSLPRLRSKSAHSLDRDPGRRSSWSEPPLQLVGWGGGRGLFLRGDGTGLGITTRAM